MKLNDKNNIIQSQIKIRMGNQCCQQQKVSIYELDVSSKIREEDFLPVQFPRDDRFLAKKVQEYKQLQGQRVMKQINNQKYYWGKWQEGAPIGKGFLYRPESYFYHGEFNLKPNDFGEIQFIQTGLTYKGQISEGRAEGQGTLTHQKGLYYYDGLWKNSQPLTGALTIRQQDNPAKKTVVTFDQFPVGQTKVTYPDGREYKGSIHHKKLLPQGRGKVTYPGGYTYEGQWTQGQFHGQGTYTWPDGSSYEGSYLYGQKHGNGKYIYPSRNIYQGQWLKNRQDGRGTLYNQKGDVLKKGIWRQGRFHTTELI